MNWYLEVLKKYAVFEGRARRKEYWMFFLFNCIFAFVMMGAGMVLEIGPIPYFIYLLAVLLPSFAVFVRRLHDIGKSGMWFFVGLIPIIGSILLIVYMVTDSEVGDNQYGPYPKTEI